MFMQVNGVQLSYVDYAPLSSNSHVTLVLLHGFTGSIASWEEHLQQFATSSLRVIAFDLLGHGQSDAPTDATRYSIEHCQHDILTALQYLGVHQGEATLLGYSMGGRIALYTALSGFFHGLILESASPGIEDATEREQRRASDEALATGIESRGIAAFVEQWERLPLFASQGQLPVKVRKRLHAGRLQNSTKGLAQSLRGVGTGSQPSLHSKLPELHIPVLLMAGELDTKFCGIARQMASLLPQAQLEIVAGAGHTIHLEKPQEFQRLVVHFIQSN